MKRKGLAIVMILAIIVILSLTGCLGSKITITFDSMGGSTVAPVKVSSDAESLKLPTPTRTGYIFEYWCYDFACTERVDASVIPTESTTFYAKWTQQVISVTFIADKTKQYRFVNYGSSLSLSEMPQVPAKEGYVGRWLTGDLANITSALTIYAEYTLDNCSITYLIDGDVYFSKDGSPGDVVETPSDPIKTGAVFLGWYSEPDYLNKVMPIDTIATTSVTLYGRLIYTADMPRYFYYEISDGKAIITGLNLAGAAQTALVIPETLGGYPVTKIGGDGVVAVQSELLQTLYIPSCVKEIGDFAFAGNEHLSDIVICEGLERIGDCAFAGCCAVEEIALPSSLISIGDCAFAGIVVNGEEDVILPLTGHLTDMYWTGAESVLTNVYFPPESHLASLGQCVFYNAALTEFTLPDSDDFVLNYHSFLGSNVLEIHSDCDNYIAVDGAVYSADGTSLILIAPQCTSLTVAADTTEIAEYAFYNSSVTAVTLPDSVITIGSHAFDSCEVAAITIEGTHLATIGEYAFLASKITSISLPSSVTSIGTGAFMNTPLTSIDLTSVHISDLPASAFRNCSALTTARIGIMTPATSAGSSIGAYAFYNCANLRIVTFPDINLTQIGDYAFADCPRLTAITLPSVTHFGDYAFAGISARSSAVIDIPRTTVSIGDYAFMNTSTAVYNPNTTSLTHMGVGAFKNCTSLARAGISQNISALPDETFYGCSRLNTVTVNASIRTLGARAFYGCTNLTSVTFKTDASGNGVTTIGESCFENCTSLGNGGGETRILPKTLTSLGARAFYNCSSLGDITLPDNLQRVASEAFAYCTALTLISYDTNCITDTLEENCFAYCTSLTSVTLPKNLDARSNTTGAIKNPFYGCGNLTSFNVLSGSILTADTGVIYISEGLYRKIYLYPTGKTGEFEVKTDVSSIDDYAFYGTHLDGLDFLSNPILGGKEDICFVAIGNYAFANSTLSSANLTNRVKSIGDYAFAGSSLSTLTINGTVVNTSSAGYNILNGYSNNLLSVGDRAFSSTKVSSVIIPARLSILGTGAFADCYSLSDLTFLTGTVSTLEIGDYAFNNDVSLRALAFPQQLTYIGDYAFADCHNVAAIDFNDAAVRIGEYAFKSNHYLYSVKLPDSLVSIAEGIFYDCSRLVDVTLSNVAIPIPAYAFYGCFALRELDVPDSMTGIGDYAFRGTNIIEITFNNGSGDFTIGKYAFAETTKLKHIYLPNNLTMIDEYAFYSSNLESFEYGAASFDVKDHAFAKSALTTVTLTGDVNLDGEYIFADTANLVGVTSSCTVIPSRAFDNSAVQTVTFVDVEEIEEYAFASTSNLTFVNIDFDKPITIEPSAFAESGVSAVNISATVLAISEDSFAFTLSLSQATINADTYSIGIGAFAGSAISTLTLNGNAAQLEEGFAMNCTNLVEINVTSEHDEYYSVDGVVYSDDGLNVTLLQYPAGKFGAVLDLDPTVTAIADFAFAGNPYLDTLTIRSSDDVTATADTFYDTLDSFTVFVPEEKTEHYLDDANYTVRISNIRAEVGEFVLTLIAGDRYALSDYTGTDTDVTIAGIITIGRTTYRIERIDKKAFQNNKVLLSVTLGNGIKEISDYAFAGCISLTDAVFGNNIASIGSHAFDGCVSLQNVVLNGEITKIGDYAFANCSTLSTISLPTKLISIGAYAFKNDVGLTTVSIPSLVELGDCAFEDASSLVSLTLPNNFKSIGNFVFRGCDNLSYLYLTSPSVVNMRNVSSLSGTYSGLKILVSENLIIDYCSDTVWRNFASSILSVDKINGNYLLTDLGNGTYRLDAYLGTEPNVSINSADTSIAEIGEYCFGQFCSTIALTGIPTIDSYAFIHSINLTSVNFSGVVSIGHSAFAGLTGLTSVNFGYDLRSIGDYCFHDCINLETITFPQQLSYIGSYAFTSIALPMKLHTVVFNGLSSVRLAIGEYAFADDAYIEELSFNCIVSAIGDFAFANCAALSAIYFNSVGGVVPAIDETSTHVFEGCDRLAIFVPTTETRRNFMGQWHNTFDKNRLFLARNVATNYENELGETIVQDGYVINPIGESSSVATIVAYIGPETVVSFPSKIKVNGTEYAIERLGRDDNNSSTVPNGKIISDSVTRIVIPSTVTSISGDAFRGAQSLRTVECANRSLLTTIGNYAFADCPNLQSVSFPKTVTNIGNYSFANDKSLTSFVIEDFLDIEIDKTSVDIGEHAFDHCTSLVSVTMPKHLRYIKSYAFNYATSLTTVLFPKDCTASSIDTYAFAYSGLVDITLPAAVGDVKDNAFAYCSSLKSVHITRTTASYSSLTTAGDNVFRGVSSPFVKVYVPETYYAQYSNAAGWSTKTVVPDLSVGDYNYRRASSTVILTGYLGSDKVITIPSTLTVGGDICRVTMISSYFGNDTLEEVYFESDSSISTLDRYAFAGCTSLRKIHLSDSIQSIGENVFYGCSSLQDVVLSNNTDLIPAYAFAGCSSLEEITLPSTVKGIGNAAFLNCSSLYRIVVAFNDAATDLGLSALDGTSSALVIIVPENRQDSFANQWSNYKNVIYDRKQLFGDFVLTDDGQGGYVLVQYSGELNIDLSGDTINGKHVTSISGNALINDVTVKI